MVNDGLIRVRNCFLSPFPLVCSLLQFYLLGFFLQKTLNSFHLFMTVKPFLRAVLRTSGWIFTKLAYVHCLKREKSLLHFGDIDFIFRVTSALCYSRF